LGREIKYHHEQLAMFMDESNFDAWMDGFNSNDWMDFVYAIGTRNFMK
jgi:hypothetical protein